MLSVITADLAGADCHAAVGLQTLVAAVVPPGNHVATRKIVASGRAVGCPRGGGDPAAPVEGGEEGGEEEEDEGGLWVPYGRRRRPRRLPPLIPSLLGTGSSPWSLTRTRTSDGRLVVSRKPAPRRGHVSARKVDGRLILELVDGPVPPPPPPQPEPLIAQEIGASKAADEEASAEQGKQGSARRDDTDVAAAEQARAPATSSPVDSSSPSPPLLGAGCFENAIRTGSLHKMHLPLPRMVH